MTLLDDYLARPARYDNVDGSAELGFGLTLLGWVVVGIALSRLPEHSAWSNGMRGFLLQSVLSTAVWAVAWWSTRLIKKHITWRRTGYAALQADPRALVVSSGVAVVLGAIFAGGLALLFTLSHDGFAGTELPRLFASLVLPGTYALWVSRMSPEHRGWKVPLAGCVLAALCIAALLSRTGTSDWLKYNLLLAGVLWLASGGMTLYFYLRRTERRDESE